ncbi:MAG: ABC transporter ATP-binding protein [Bacteroidia bacterium]|nr:ABC transporter ATP-binding protein [Bacteroidia bacterium]
MEIFCAKDVVKRYANHLALDKVSIDVPGGSIFGLLGPNGAGKTTLIRIINQIIAPDAGELYFEGRKLTIEHTLQFGYLPEERGLYKKMKVGEQSLYLACLKGLSKKEAQHKIKHWFSKFEIMPWWDKKVEELSKGMAQKLQFVITVLHEPKLLIFDEPFTGFDPINTNLLKQEILALKQNGSTIIFSTHNMASVEELCDYITLINESKCILNGHIDDIKKNYKTNTYEICFSGYFNKFEATLTSLYQILEHKQQNDITSLRIKISAKTNTNELLSIMMKYGNVISFNEILPSMNDIFIRVVEEASISNN